MTFRTESTLAGYARAAVDLRIRMAEYSATTDARRYVDAKVATDLDAIDHPGSPDTGADNALVVDVIARASTAAWSEGDPYVLAPAMTAIVAGAAQALDLTGDLLDADAAPCEHGILFLPEPIYHQYPGGLRAVSAITWSTISSSRQRSWLICSWWDTHDPRHSADADALRPVVRLGPYMLGSFDLLPIAEPVPAPDQPGIDEPERGWETAPDGRYVVSDRGARTQVLTAILYAFWCIQEQKIATVAHPPLDRTTIRRAQRGRIGHETRIVMLRRSNPIDESGGGEPRWQYQVRFFVRGHWRHYTSKDGRAYKVWIHTYIKGPDGAPLIHGEKVNILAR